METESLKVDKNIMENDVDVAYFHKIDLKRNTSVPIYRQIVDFVDNGISQSSIQTGNRLPSINETSKEKNISRHTVEKAYKVLRQKGSIQSIPGRGYFINGLNKKKSTRVFVLINNLCFNKSQILDCICDANSAETNFDLEIHFVDDATFKLKIDECGVSSDHVLVVGFSKQYFQLLENRSEIKVNGDNTDVGYNKCINTSDDYRRENVSYIYQNFEKDFYLILQEMNVLSKYDQIVLVISKNVFPENQKGIKSAMAKYCNDHYRKYEIRNEIKDRQKVRKGQIFIVFGEDDLVHLLKLLKGSKLKLGIDVGIICFNDSPLKALMAISVISIDFNILGELVTSMILKKIKGSIKNEYQFIDRGSV